MKRCPQCGRFSEDDASFCPWCGYDLPEHPDYPAYGSYSPSPQPVYRPRRRGPSIGMVVGAVAVAAILLAVGISVMDDLVTGDGYTDRTVTHSWTVPSIDDSPTFSVSVKISSEEMVSATGSTIDREGSTTNVSDHSSKTFAVYEYVVVSDAVKDVSDALWAEFKEKIVDDPAYSSYADAEHFADYVLAYVQEAADYAYDDQKFGQDEYWQYPVETLYRGYGDCEDTSILASAIYNRLAAAEGAKDLIDGASVLLLPGHAMVGVAVVGGVSGSGNYKVVHGGVTYYTGETTLDDPSGVSPSYWSDVGHLSEGYWGASMMVFSGTCDGYY